MHSSYEPQEAHKQPLSTWSTWFLGRTSFLTRNPQQDCQRKSSSKTPVNTSFSWPSDYIVQYSSHNPGFDSFASQVPASLWNEYSPGFGQTPSGTAPSGTAFPSKTTNWSSGSQRAQQASSSLSRMPLTFSSLATLEESGRDKHESNQNSENYAAKRNLLFMIFVLVLVVLIIIVIVVVTGNQPPSLTLSGPIKEFNKGNYTIELEIVSQVTDPRYLDAIVKGRERWEQVILDELPSISNLGANTEGCPGQPETRQSSIKSINNLLVFVFIKEIDGPGGTLARSGPCRFDAQSFPRTGLLVLDVADVGRLLADNNLENIVRHEIGHVLGLGTSWDAFRLITPSGILGPIEYLGGRGRLGQLEVGGTGNPTVESSGGTGTARGHWAEDIYKTELMTGFFFTNQAPLSRLTIRALEDLGYRVDVNRADTYSLPRRLLQEAPLKIERETHAYGDDIFEGPYYRIESETKPGRAVFLNSRNKLFWATLLDPDAGRSSNAG